MNNITKKDVKHLQIHAGGRGLEAKILNMQVRKSNLYYESHLLTHIKNSCRMEGGRVLLFKANIFE